jgi:hypothetical protein
MASLSVADIADALGGAYGPDSGGNYRCRCPIHNSTRSSLSLRDGWNGLIIHCFAGCDRNEIRDELCARGLLDSTIDTTTEPLELQRDAERDAKRADRVKAIWAACQPAGGPLSKPT